ncbi:N-alpha-acetyltransferase 35 NatC auxiliary subunit [Terramyces sp. JEL0728]|nr:N-alpha-acetyltransferase 35 NatC auxiliary subunit [Terramyces sp. JEL0728]
MEPFAQDITNDFKEACSSELMYSQKFSFFQAMTAIPLMDPTMDTGMDYVSDKWSLEDAQKELDLSQLVGLVDALFVSLLDHLTANEKDKHAEYLVEIIKTEAVLAREIINSSQIYFEEDFFPELQGIDLEAAEYDELAEIFEQLKPGFLKGDDKLTNALKDRIEFHLQFIQMLQLEAVNEKTCGLFSRFDYTVGADMQDAFEYKFNRYLFTTTTPDQKKLSIADGFRQWKDLLAQLVYLNQMKSNYVKVNPVNID